MQQEYPTAGPVKTKRYEGQGGSISLGASGPATKNLNDTGPAGNHPGLPKGKARRKRY